MDGKRLARDTQVTPLEAQALAVGLVEQAYVAWKADPSTKSFLEHVITLARREALDEMAWCLGGIESKGLTGFQYQQQALEQLHEKQLKLTQQADGTPEGGEAS